MLPASIADTPAPLAAWRLEMLLRPDDLPDGGLRVDVAALGGVGRRAVAVAMDGRSPRVEGWLLARRRGQGIEISGRLAGSVDRSCDRCGGELHYRIEAPVALTYVPPPEGPGGALDASQVDAGFLRDGAIEAADVVQEHFALLLPPRVTCDAPGAAPLGTPCSPRPPQAPEDPAPDPRLAPLLELDLEH